MGRKILIQPSRTRDNIEYNYIQANRLSGYWTVQGASTRRLEFYCVRPLAPIVHRLFRYPIRNSVVFIQMNNSLLIA